jgi:hypothetical protein
MRQYDGGFFATLCAKGPELPAVSRVDPPAQAGSQSLANPA